MHALDATAQDGKEFAASLTDAQNHSGREHDGERDGGKQNRGFHGFPLRKVAERICARPNDR